MKRLLPLGLALLAATPALAHPGHGGGFAAGLGHPLGGIDHVLAMLAVGLWAALRGGRAAMAWPAAFVAAMAAGFVAVQAGLAVPQVETMIAGSVILLGAAVALRLAGPIWIGAVAIAAFGLAHGAAHGAEASGAPALFAIGFVLASLSLHVLGFAPALLADGIASRWPLRIAGAGMAAAGLALAFSI
jgi:urease accessory protein